MPAIMLTNNNEQILNPVPTESPDLSVDLQYLTVIGIPDKRNKKPPGTNKINKPSLYLIKINKHGTNTPNKANHGKTATQYHKKLSRDSKPLTRFIALCGRLRLCRTTAARTKNSLVSHLCAAMSTIFRTLYLCFFKIILDELSSVKTFCVVCDINFLWIKNFAKVSNITETAAL